MTRVVLSLVVALSVFSCVPSTLNKTCTFKFGDGGVMPESFARNLTLKDKDFVAIGIADCDTLICVRDSNFKAPADVKDTDPAVGYCSQECTPNASQNPCGTDVPADDQPNSPKQLKCRNLLLNEQVLADPAVGPLLGGIKSSTFCARGNAADAGI